MGCTLFLFPGGREFQRRSREQQGQSEHRASKRAPLPAMGQLMGPPACASPLSMACTALGQLRPNTASDHLALTPRHHSHPLQALQDPRGISRKEPALIPHSSRAELLTEQTLVLPHASFQSCIPALPRPFHQDLLSCLLQERQSHPPTRPVLSEAGGRSDAEGCSSSLRVKLHFPGSEWHLQQIVNEPKPGLRRSERAGLPLGQP